MDSKFSKILLEKYQSGDSNAAFEIHARYAQRLFALARVKIGDRLVSKVDPDDVVQTALLAFFQKADRSEIFWNKEGDLWRLLSAICINHVKREAEFHGAAKRHAGREQVLPDGLERDLDDAGDRLAELLETVTQNETPLTNRIINARLAGYTLLEIAGQLGRSERTIRRVLQMLKAKLAMMSELNPAAHLTSTIAAGDTIRSEQFDANYDDYDLLRMLGAGAFGKVYLARDRRTDSLVAVKALKRSWIGDTAAESLFLNEARVLQSVEHPNIVKFLEVGPLPNGSYFFAMEFADGDTLDQRMSHGVLKQDALRWIEQICSALMEIHRCGTTHGDLKPSNVIVSDESIRLIDFGFSKRAKDSNPIWLGGTVGFTAPEKISSPAADVFSLGRIIKRIVKHPQSEFGENVDLKLEELASIALHADPWKRPEASELISEIRVLKSQ